MARNSPWDVSIGGRIEEVTDLADFPERLRAELAKDPDAVVVDIIEPVIPHTTRFVLRVNAKSAKSAEATARDIALRSYANVARSVLGARTIAWTMGCSATKVKPERPRELHD